jgi:uncharacterized membrane protein YsdA (DUF1294 family)
MNTGSSLFILSGAILFLIFFGLPLFLAPMAWARRVGWRIPEDRDLANYLGRSLGGVVLAVIVMAFQAARDPWQYRFVFELTIWMGLFMVAVHAYGFIKKNQPLLEHLEIVLYGLLVFLSWYFYPTPS